MTIAQMHVWFRQYAQQMGMQNVRAILPEQIDLLINTSITDFVNQLIKENIGITNDRVITDNSKIGQINALRTLYHVKEVQCFREDSGGHSMFVFEPSYSNIGKITTKLNTLIGDYMFVVDFSLNYRKYKKINIDIRVPNGLYDSNNQSDHEGDEEESMFIVDYDEKSQITNYFPIRLIDDIYLADTLNDFVLKNRMRSPIAVIYNNQLDLYIDKFTNKQYNGDGDYQDQKYDSYSLENDLIPYNIRVSYIAKPKQVKYAEDINGQNVDCDLPEYTHVDILKHAVDLYRIAVSGALQGAQQQEQNQQQENMRNNYRNDGNVRQQQ